MKSKLIIFLLVLCSFESFGQNDQSPVKILAIGNSFSVDAVESYLSDLAIAADIPVIIGNAWIAGSSLEKHWDCAENNLNEYTYTKISEAGERITQKDINILPLLTDEEWDYISFQQSSSLSGITESFSPYLENLLSYVRSHVKSPKTKYILHMTWPYEKTAKHPGFANYQKDQNVMFNAIKTAYTRIAQTMDFDLIVPSGIAIQYVRDATDKILTIDGFHLAKGLGRYTASCTWFETLLGQSVTGNSFHPEEMTEEEALIAQRAAQQAVEAISKVCHTELDSTDCGLDPQ